MTKLIQESTSIRQIIQKLNLSETGGTYANFKKIIRYYNLDTSHFTGHGWSKGLTKDNNESLKKSSINKRFSSDVLFSENSPPSIVGCQLRERLIEEGREYKCEKCGLKAEWEGKKLTLQVDHINGINNDNRKENLRFLCPNCHSQTETWGTNNIKK